jgi:hypothetical protein
MGWFVGPNGSQDNPLLPFIEAPETLRYELVEISVFTEQEPRISVGFLDHGGDALRQGRFDHTVQVAHPHLLGATAAEIAAGSFAF